MSHHVSSARLTIVNLWNHAIWILLRHWWALGWACGDLVMVVCRERCWPCHYVKEFDHVLTFSNQAVFRDSLHRPYTPSITFHLDIWWSLAFLAPCIAAEVLVVIKSYQLDHPRSTIPIWRGSIRPTIRRTKNRTNQVCFDVICWHHD